MIRMKPPETAANVRYGGINVSPGEAVSVLEIDVPALSFEGWEIVDAPVVETTEGEKD